MEDGEWEVVWGMPGYLAVRYSWVGDLWGSWAVNSMMYTFTINFCIYIPTSLCFHSNKAFSCSNQAFTQTRHSLKFVKAERFSSQRPPRMSFFPTHSLRGISCMLYPVSPVVPSCKSIAQYHTQDNDTGIHIGFILIAPLLMNLGVCVYVYLFLCNFITNVDSFIYYQSRNRTIPSPQKDLLSYLARHTSFHPLTTPSLTPWQPLICSIQNFVISKWFYKWNHTVCKLLGLAFSLTIIPLRFI